MTPFIGIRLLLVIALSAGLPHAAIAQEAGLPTPLTLADVIRVASQRRDEIAAARARTRAGEARRLCLPETPNMLRRLRLRALQ